MSLGDRRAFSHKVTVPVFTLVFAAVSLILAVVLLTYAALNVATPATYPMLSVGEPEERAYPEALLERTPLKAATERASAGLEGTSADAWLTSPGAVSASGLDAVARKIIKDASVSVQVTSFRDVVARAASICEAQGGYVQSSSAQASEDELRSGTVVLRVPSDKFDAVLADIEGLGKVRSKEVAGRDVTEEYVDLEARLSNWQQQEKQLLAIMAKASKVSDILQVQAELGRVREEIERITGRLKYLNSQIDFSTITAEFFEPSVVSEVPRDWGFVRALERAVAASVNTVNAIVVFAGGVAPVALLAVAA